MCVRHIIIIILTKYNIKQIETKLLSSLTLACFSRNHIISIIWTSNYILKKSNCRWLTRSLLFRRHNCSRNNCGGIFSVPGYTFLFSVPEYTFLFSVPGYTFLFSLHGHLSLFRTRFYFSLLCTRIPFSYLYPDTFLFSLPGYLFLFSTGYLSLLCTRIPFSSLYPKNELQFFAKFSHFLGSKFLVREITHRFCFSFSKLIFAKKFAKVKRKFFHFFRESFRSLKTLMSTLLLSFSITWYSQGSLSAPSFWKLVL